MAQILWSELAKEHLRVVIARSGSGCEALPKQTRRFLVPLGTGSAIFKIKWTNNTMFT